MKEIKIRYKTSEELLKEKEIAYALGYPTQHVCRYEVSIDGEVIKNLKSFAIQLDEDSYMDNTTYQLEKYLI